MRGNPKVIEHLNEALREELADHLGSARMRILEILAGLPPGAERTAVAAAPLAMLTGSAPASVGIPDSSEVGRANQAD